MRTKTQWVVESSNPKTHYGFSHYRKTEEEAKQTLERLQAAYPKLELRMFKETWKVA